MAMCHVCALDYLSTLCMRGGKKKKESLHVNINRVYFGASTTADFSVMFKSIAKLDWI